MPITTPVTQTIDADVAGERWNELLDRVAHGEARVVVEAGGVAVAAIVSADDLKRLDRFDAEVAADLAILEASQAAFADQPRERREAEIAAAVAAARSGQRPRHEP